MECAVDAPVAIGQPAVASLRQALKDRNEYTRAYAATALGRSRAREVVPELVRMIGDGSEETRSKAMEDVTLIPRLMPYLEDKSTWAGRAAVSAIDALQKTVERSPFPVQREAARPVNPCCIIVRPEIRRNKQVICCIYKGILKEK